MIEQQCLGDSLQYLDEIIMPPNMSQFVRQEGLDVLWREPRDGGGGKKDSRL